MQVIANLSVWLSMSLCISSKQILNKKELMFCSVTHSGNLPIYILCMNSLIFYSIRFFYFYFYSKLLACFDELKR